MFSAKNMVFVYVYIFASFRRFLRVFVSVSYFINLISLDTIANCNEHFFEHVVLGGSVIPNSPLVAPVENVCCCFVLIRIFRICTMCIAHSSPFNETNSGTAGDGYKFNSSCCEIGTINLIDQLWPQQNSFLFRSFRWDRIRYERWSPVSSSLLSRCNFKQETSGLFRISLIFFHFPLATDFPLPLPKNRSMSNLATWRFTFFVESIRFRFLFIDIPIISLSIACRMAFCQRSDVRLGQMITLKIAKIKATHHIHELLQLKPLTFVVAQCQSNKYLSIGPCSLCVRENPSKITKISRLFSFSNGQYVLFYIGQWRPESTECSIVG